MPVKPDLKKALVMTDLPQPDVTDPQRLAALDHTNLLDTLPEEAFDRLTRLAAELLNVPTALVSLVDDKRQFFKSCFGLDGVAGDDRETPLTHSICQYVVTSGEPLVISDTRIEPNLEGNLAITDLGVVAYAGIPLVGPDGYVIGSFCVIDAVPHEWSERDIRILRELAHCVMTEIVLRTDILERTYIEQELRKVEERVRLFTENATDLIARHTPEGDYLYASPASQELLGVSVDELIGQSLLDFVHRDDMARVREGLETARESSEATLVVYRVSPNPGRRVWLETKIRALRSPETEEILELHTVSRDITERKQAEADLSNAYNRERRIAETLQRSLLLTLPEDTFPALKVATFYEPALDEALVGGDFFDAFPLSEDIVALVVGDVAGKGLAAAARTAELKYSLRAFLREYPDPGAALTHLNDHMYEIQRLEDAEVMTFTILALAVINTQTGSVKFAAAGAEAPLIIRTSGQPEVIKVGGIALGVAPGYHYAIEERQLQGRDTIVLATDGITEARVGSNLLGYDRMVGLAKQAFEIPSLHQMGQMILDGARAFSGGTLLDDTCLVLARRRVPTK